MVRLIVKTLYMVAGLLLIYATAHAQEDIKVSGLAYGEYYGIVKNHEEKLEGQNAFLFRRIYLTFDRKLNEEFDVRVRFEINSAGDFTSKSKMEPFIKDAFIKWSRDKHSIFFGISSTPTWAVIEPVWGYRSVERTPLDLNKFGSSRDFGIAFKGSIDEEKKIGYHIMLANGNSTSSEVGKGKKILASLSFSPGSGYVLEGYVDYDDRPNNTRRITVQGFAGLKLEKLRMGLQFVHQARRISGDRDDLKLQVLSAFIVKQLRPKLLGFFRYDKMFDPNPDGAKIAYIPFDPTAKSNFILAGIDFKASPTVSIIPNFEAVIYEKNSSGVTPDTDFIPRLTFAVFF
jgi:hypothetical protein